MGLNKYQNQGQRPKYEAIKPSEPPVQRIIIHGDTPKEEVEAMITKYLGMGIMKRDPSGRLSIKKV